MMARPTPSWGVKLRVAKLIASPISKQGTAIGEAINLATSR